MNSYGASGGYGMGGYGANSMFGGGYGGSMYSRPVGGLGGMYGGGYGGSGMYGTSGYGGTYGGGGGMYGASGYGANSYGSGMYGGGGSMYGAGVYGAGGMYGASGYGQSMAVGAPGGVPGGPGMQPGGLPGARTKWQVFMETVNGLMHFFGRVSFLMDENAHAVHFFITALLQLLDRASFLWGELARFVLRLLGYKHAPPARAAGNAEQNGSAAGAGVQTAGQAVQVQRALPPSAQVPAQKGLEAAWPG